MTGKLPGVSRLLAHKYCPKRARARIRRVAIRMRGPRMQRLPGRLVWVN